MHNLDLFKALADERRSELRDTFRIGATRGFVRLPSGAYKSARPRRSR